MYGYLRAGLVLLFALGCIGDPLQAGAQQESVGRIERIAEILGGRSEREIRQATDKVQIRREGSDTWIDVAPRAALSLAERLRVERFVDARLQVNRGAQRGALTFLPELLRRGGGAVFPPAVVGEQLAEGLYAVGSGPGPSGELMVSVERGALVVDWVHGRLVVQAAGTRTVVTGTRLALSVNPEGDQGLLYLETGAISFPDFPELRVSPGEFVHLRRGLPPTLWPHGAVEPAQVAEAIQYHNQQVWVKATPLWRTPAFLVAAAVVVGVATYASFRRGYPRS